MTTETQMKVLVANRGEIAIRVLRACRDLGVQTVAVYSEGDREALHTRYADEAVCIGPTVARDSYLSIRAVIEAARRTGAHAVHPGYGFLSENAEFAEAVEEDGITFIGPDARNAAPDGRQIGGAPCGARGRTARAARPRPRLSGDARCGGGGGNTGPVLVKAMAGGGGRGIRLVRRPEELAAMMAAARREAQAAFGDDTVYLEPLVQPARHIEVQILGDGTGEVVCLGERECSVQRRRQKLIEESPAPRLSDGAAPVYLRRGGAIGTRARVSQPGHGRVPVEPRGVPLHRGQPAHSGGTSGDRDGYGAGSGQGAVVARAGTAAAIRAGVSCAARCCDRGAGAGGSRASEARWRRAGRGCAARTGTITYLKEPGGPGIRVDSALYQGMGVTADYDSLLAKVIAWGESRCRDTAATTCVAGVPDWRGGDGLGSAVADSWRPGVRGGQCAHDFPR